MTEVVGLLLIMGYRDATIGVMSLVRRALLLYHIYFHFLKGGTGVCLFSNFLLFRIRYVRYLIAFWWIFCMRVLIACLGILRFVSLLRECSCVAPLTHAVMATTLRHLTIKFNTVEYLLCTLHNAFSE